MKKILSFLICTILLISTALPSYATESTNVISCEEFILDNGFICIDEISVNNLSRSSNKEAVRNWTIKDGDTVIAKIEMTVVFHYDGSSVSVVSKSVTQKDTYDGWSYKQTSFTSSGGTVTLKFKLTKWLILSNSYTMTLTCDKNGNLS